MAPKRIEDAGALQTAMENQENRVVSLDDLIALLKDFMGDAGDKDPHMPKGLQVRGREESSS